MGQEAFSSSQEEETDIELVAGGETKNPFLPEDGLFAEELGANDGSVFKGRSLDEELEVLLDNTQKKGIVDIVHVR